MATAADYHHRSRNQRAQHQAISAARIGKSSRPCIMTLTIEFAQFLRQQYRLIDIPLFVAREHRAEILAVAGRLPYLHPAVEEGLRDEGFVVNRSLG